MVAKVDGPSPFYDLALALHDARGKSIGMVVIEPRGPALIQKRIPNEAALFENK
jgi:hypothetical protein